MGQERRPSSTSSQECSSLTQGHIYLKGEEITGKKPYEIARRGVGRTYQIIRIFPKMTLLENLIVVGKGKGKKDDRKGNGPSSSGQTGGEERTTMPLTFRFGQQKLLSLAQVLMLDPRAHSS